MMRSGTNAQPIAGIGGQNWSKDIQMFPVPSGKYVKFVKRRDGLYTTTSPSGMWDSPVFPFNPEYNDFCYFYPCMDGMMQTGGSYFSSMGFPDYSKGFDIRNSNGNISGWVAPEDGWLIFGCRYNSDNYCILMRADNLNGDNIVKIGGTGGQDYDMDYQFIPINKGDTLMQRRVGNAYHEDENCNQTQLKKIWDGEIGAADKRSDKIRNVFPNQKT